MFARGRYWNVLWKRTLWIWHSVSYNVLLWPRPKCFVGHSHLHVNEGLAVGPIMASCISPLAIWSHSQPFTILSSCIRSLPACKYKGRLGYMQWYQIVRGCRGEGVRRGSIGWQKISRPYLIMSVPTRLEDSVFERQHQLHMFSAHRGPIKGSISSCGTASPSCP